MLMMVVDLNYFDITYKIDPDLDILPDGLRERIIPHLKKEAGSSFRSREPWYE